MLQKEVDISQVIIPKQLSTISFVIQTENTFPWFFFKHLFCLTVDCPSLDGKVDYLHLFRGRQHFAKQKLAQTLELYSKVAL
jgi:hypothetical protein